MNALSVAPAWQMQRFAAPAVVAAVVAVLLAAVTPPGLAQGAAAAGNEPIVASLNPPPYGLGCEAAAAATSVYFQFANPPFQISQISLYLDGRGVPQDAVREQWPTVTLARGLHPGSNTIDIVASGASGQQIQRRMLVQVGGAPSATPAAGGAGGSAQVPCADGAAAPAQQTAAVPGGEFMTYQAPPIAPEQAPPPVAVDDTPQSYYDAQYEPPQPAYDDAPAYYYSAYPAFGLGTWVPLVPFFGFGFFYSHYHPHFAPPRVVVNGGYDHGHWNGGWGGNGGNWHPGGGGFASGHYMAPTYAAPRNAVPFRGGAAAPVYRNYAPPARPVAVARVPYRAPQYAPQPQYRAPVQSGSHGAPSGGGEHGGGHGGGGRHR